MKITVRVELVADRGETTMIEVARFERPCHLLGPESVGSTLANSKQLLSKLQQTVIPAQIDELCATHRLCSKYLQQTTMKDYWQHKIDTVFGTVSVRSPRIMTCPCEPPDYLEAL
jgi:hypothetical protein